jgi:hypothetical protein
VHAPGIDNVKWALAILIDNLWIVNSQSGAQILHLYNATNCLSGGMLTIMLRSTSPHVFTAINATNGQARHSHRERLRRHPVKQRSRRQRGLKAPGSRPQNSRQLADAPSSRFTFAYVGSALAIRRGPSERTNRMMPGMAPQTCRK